MQLSRGSWAKWVHANQSAVKSMWEPSRVTRRTHLLRRTAFISLRADYNNLYAVARANSQACRKHFLINLFGKIMIWCRGEGYHFLPLCIYLQPSHSNGPYFMMNVSQHVSHYVSPYIPPHVSYRAPHHVMPAFLTVFHHVAHPVSHHIPHHVQNCQHSAVWPLRQTAPPICTLHLLSLGNSLRYTYTYFYIYNYTNIDLLVKCLCLHLFKMFVIFNMF